MTGRERTGDQEPHPDDDRVSGREIGSRQFHGVNCHVDPHLFPPESWTYPYVCPCLPLYALTHHGVKGVVRADGRALRFGPAGGDVMSDHRDSEGLRAPVEDRGDPDRWGRVFADLEAEAQSLADAELAEEIADRTRREFARIRVTDRLGAARHRQLTVHIRDAPAGSRTLRLRVTDVGTDWLMGTNDDGLEPTEWLLPSSSLIAVDDPGPLANDPDTRGFVDQRRDVRLVLREWVRDRGGVVVGVADLGEVAGRLDRVGADHVDLATRTDDGVRRDAPRPATRTLTLGAIRWVRRGRPG